MRSPINLRYVKLKINLPNLTSVSYWISSLTPSCFFIKKKGGTQYVVRNVSLRQ